MRTPWFRRPRYLIPVGGISLGLFAGIVMIEDAQTIGRAGTRPTVNLSAASVTGAYVSDPIARDMGYTMAMQQKATSETACESKSAEFRRGCLEYVSEQHQ